MSPKIYIDDKEVEIIEDVDENDIEELLKSKISWKNILKIVILIIFVVVVVYFSVSGVFPSDFYIYVIVFLCIVGGAILISLDHEEDVNKQTVSSLKCLKCDFQRINSYNNGDYIFKIMEKCSNCDGNLQIAEIYSVKLAEKQKKEKKK
jgi:hypothetical protein